MRWLNGTRVEPTVVFKEILSLPLSKINQTLDRFENDLDYLFRAIHSAVYIFIDKVDQGIRALPRQAWINVQGGLIEAAWDVWSTNTHVKIYATIREEAFANHESDLKGNLYGATALLRYSPDELHQLTDQLVDFYEGLGDFKEFMKLPVVRNMRTEIAEDSFRYLHRHTLGRPRDIVIACSQISRERERLTETRYRELVNEVSSGTASNIFKETGPFLGCLADEAGREQLFALLPYNILSRQELIDICCKFNDMSPQSYGAIGSSGDVFKHPFCELWSCGLLGAVFAEGLGGSATQRFKRAHDEIAHSPGCLPCADYYLLHPSFQSVIHRNRRGLGYHIFKFIVVGHGYPWIEHYPSLIEVQRELFRASFQTQIRPGGADLFGFKTSSCVNKTRRDTCLARQAGENRRDQANTR